MTKMMCVLVLVLTMFVAGCGGAGGEPVFETVDSTAAPSTSAAPLIPAEPTPLVLVAETGGCYMMGPNCPTALIMSDGSFAVFRNDPAAVIDVPDDFELAEYTGHVDIEDLAESIASTDFDGLRENLNPGTCRGCFDGIDVFARFFTVNGPEDLDSQQYEFDAAVDLFSQLDEVRSAVGEAGAMDLLPRGS